MKKSRNKIIIKSKKGGHTKIYANGKWQKGVYNIDFRASVTPNGIETVCVFDKYKTYKNGLFVMDKKTNKLINEHCSANI